MKFTYALVCALCITLTPVMSQFQGFRQNTRMPYPLLPLVPMNRPVWMGQNGLMGFPNNMGMMIPQPMPMWTGGMMAGRFQPWQQSTNWQTSWNNNNNFIPTGSTNNGAGVSTSTTTGQTTDPWKAYQQFSSGMNSVLGGTQSMLGSNPLLSSTVGSNGASSKNYPWNTFATNQPNVPMVPSNGNNGPFVGAGNSMNPINGGLMNQFPTSGLSQNGGLLNQFPTSGLTQNGGLLNQFPTSGLSQNGGLAGGSVNGGNRGLVNSQFQTSAFPQNGGLAGNANGMNSMNGAITNNPFSSSATQQNSGLTTQTQGLNLNQFKWP